MVQPIVYLPIELKHRELDSRLMTAVHLLDAGICVVLGQQWAIFQNAATWPPGLILFKTVNAIQASNMANFRRHGHAVMATDEEVLTVVNDFCIAFSPLAAKACNLFFAQNEKHRASVVQRFPELREKTVVTGNPRIEITSRDGRRAFQAAADDIRSQIGPFILLNTNYSSINSLWGSLAKVYNLLVMAGLIDATRPDAEDIFKSWMKWEVQNRNDMLEFLTWAAANSHGRKVVIRPHPAEQLDFWLKFVNDHPNVMVVPKTNHMPWIMATDLVVHTSCTTGLEAVLLEKPALNIEAYPDPSNERITSMVNPTFKTAPEAIAAADAFLRDGTGPIAEFGNNGGLLEQFFPGFDTGGAARNIAEQFLNFVRANGADTPPQPFWEALIARYRRIERNEQTNEKMFISFEDMVRAFEANRARVGVTRKARISAIDDSLFLFEPV